MVRGYIVEHMEEELFDWCILEYLHIETTIGKNRLIVTRLPENAAGHEEFVPNGKNRFAESAFDLFNGSYKVCLLDSEARDALTPEDGKHFDYILAGGILGDVGENDLDRTKELRKLGFATRNLGPVQMTTDTAIITAARILDKSIAFEQLRFVDKPTFQLGKYEAHVMPFRYLEDAPGRPLLAPGMLALWKNQ